MDIDARKTFDFAGGKTSFFSLPELEKQGAGNISRMPVCLRIVLESLLRNLDGKRVREQDIRTLAAWQPRAERTEEIPFVVARVLLQDFTGVPLVVDLAAMRQAVQRAGKAPKRSIWSSTTPSRWTSPACPMRCSSTWASSSPATAPATSSSSGGWARSTGSRSSRPAWGSCTR
jgi:hypothetical protein